MRISPGETLPNSVVISVVPLRGSEYSRRLDPIEPTTGCVHKHFNKHPGQAAMWMAWIYSPYMDELGKWVEQKEVSPDFKQKG